MGTNFEQIKNDKIQDVPRQELSGIQTPREWNLLTAIKKRDNPAIVCAKVVKPCAPLPLKSPNLRSSKNRGERKGAVTRRLFFLSSLAS